MESIFQSGIEIDVPKDVMKSGKAVVVAIVRRTDENRNLVGFAYHLAELLPNGNYGVSLTRSEAEIQAWQIKPKASDVKLVAGLPV